MDRIRNLIISLDELALLSSKIDYTFDERDYQEPPEVDYKVLYETISKAFPSLGYYNIALDVAHDIEKTSLSLANAIEDIVDITSDLTGIIWCYENTSKDDALWHLEFLFRAHWGRHLRNLQLYLHDFYW